MPGYNHSQNDNKVRLESKDYIVQEDMLNIGFNV